MEQQPPFSQAPQDQYNHPYMQRNSLPNAVAVLVLGICSIFPGCFCFGIIGMVCGIISLVLAKKDLALYRNNPGLYSQASLNNLNAGRICAIVGLCLSAIVLIIYIIYFLIIGAAISMVPWGNFH